MLTAISLAFLAITMTPIKVELRQTEGRWELLRGGQPYFVKGVGGTQHMEKLKSLGGNSVRTWGTDRLATELTEAHRLGMTVAAGIWLGHVGHGFNYNDPAMLQRQKDQVREEVLRFRNQPALLVWGLGNEMEINNDRPELWKHINELALMVKDLDPNHPTMTVVADFSDEKIANINKYAPAIDILGINSYGGLRSVPERLKKAGWTKPYLVTEFGPSGPWEVTKTSWGAPLEPTSTEKAAKYLADYQASIAGQPGWCLGSYAFLWGEKQEATPTWFGMFLKSGETVESVDAMSFAWTGKWPEARAPQVQRVEFAAAGKDVNPGQALSAEASGKDPNGNPLTYSWTLKPEVDEMKYAGEGERRPEALDTELQSQRGAKVTFKAPAKAGPYRLYVTILDGTGRAATANLPFRVR